MPLRPLAPATIRLSLLLGAFAASAALACAEGAQGAGASDAPTERAARDSARAPQDTVDSLDAARRATVMDTLPLPPLPKPKPKVDTATKTATATTSDTTQPDTAKKKVPRGSIGPRAGERHLAFRDVGSPEHIRKLVISAQQRSEVRK